MREKEYWLEKGSATPLGEQQTWATFGCSSKNNFINSTQSISFGIAVASSEKVLKRPGSSPSVTAVQNHAQVFGNNSRTTTVFDLEKKNQLTS